MGLVLVRYHCWELSPQSKRIDMTKIVEMLKEYKKAIIAALITILAMFGVISNANNRANGHDFTFGGADVNITYSSDRGTQSPSEVLE